MWTLNEIWSLDAFHRRDHGGDLPLKRERKLVYETLVPRFMTNPRSLFDQAVQCVVANGQFNTLRQPHLALFFKPMFRSRDGAKEAQF